MAFLEDKDITQVAEQLQEKNKRPTVRDLQGTGRLLYDRLQEAGLNPKICICGDFVTGNQSSTGIAYMSPKEKQFRKKLNKARKNVCEGMQIEYKGTVFTWEDNCFRYDMSESELAGFGGQKAMVGNNEREYEIIVNGTVVKDTRKSTNMEIKRLEGFDLYEVQVKGSTRVGNLSTSYDVLASSCNETGKVARQMAREEKGYKNARVTRTFVRANHPLVNKTSLETVL